LSLSALAQSQREEKTPPGLPAVQVRQGGMKLDRRSRRRGGEPTFLPLTLRARHEQTVNQKPPVLLFSSAYCATHPPSSAIGEPVIWSAAGLHRKSTVCAICSGVVNSFDGCFSPSRAILAASGDSFSAAALASICFCTSGVGTQPGQMATQVMP